MADLYLALNGEYFDQIRDGEKLEEYRLCTDYWRKRLDGRTYQNIILTRGYPKGGGMEGVTKLTRPWRGYRKCVITHRHFGPDAAAVFAIDVSPA